MKLVSYDKNELKRSIDQWLWEGNTLTALTLRTHLSTYFFQFKKLVIIGGMVRDFARGGYLEVAEGARFKSDIDIVIDAPEAEVAELARSIGAKSNRYGGYTFLREDDHRNCKIDFWALETTKALQPYTKPIPLRDIINYTFFDCDSILYDIHTREIVCDDDYFTKLSSGIIDIKYPVTHSVSGALLRTLRRIHKWDVDPSPALACFVNAHLDTKLDEIIRKEQEKYDGDSIAKRFSRQTYKV